MIYSAADIVSRPSDENAADAVGGTSGQLTTSSAQPLHYMYTRLSAIQYDEKQAAMQTRELIPEGYSESVDTILYCQPKGFNGQRSQASSGDEYADNNASGFTCVGNISLEGHDDCAYSVPRRI